MIGRLVVRVLLATTLLACRDPASRIDLGPPFDQRVSADRALDASTTRDLGVDRRADGPRKDQTRDVAPGDAACPDPGVSVAPGIRVSPTQLVAGQSATIVYAAPAKLSSSSSLTLHLGTNYWMPSGPTTATDLPMTRRADGAFEATIVVPVTARLLDFVFFTGGGAAKTWDNNGGLDYHRAVGVPLLGPYLTYRDNLAGQPERDPATSITVSFRSDHACRGRVRYGTSATALTQVLDEPSAKTQHHMHLTQLSPSTHYHYRVECTATEACAPAELAPVASFRTAAQSPTSFTFLHLSDPQDTRSAKDRWSEVATRLTTPPDDDFAFFLVTGDLVGDDTPARWWDFFDRGRPLLSSKPMLPVVGNHDTPTAASNMDTSSFEGLFDFASASGTDTRYAFRYGSAAFMVLLSESAQVTPADWKPGGTQYGWVSSTLSTLGTAAVWRFAAWHIPPYNAGNRHAGQVDTVRPMTALFDDTVDWVLCGHEHLYQRFKPLRYADKIVSSHGGPGGGVGYLIAPVAGHDPPEDTLLPTSSSARNLLAYPTGPAVVNNQVAKWAGWVRLAVSGKSISIQAYSLDESAPKDTLSYSKP